MAQIKIPLILNIVLGIFILVLPSMADQILHFQTLGTIVLASLVTIFAIVFGENIEEFTCRMLFLAKDFSLQTEIASSTKESSWQRLAASLTSREALLPIFMVLGLLLNGLIQQEGLVENLLRRADMVMIVLTYAVIACGIKESGYFKYAAYRVLEVCDGNITRLTFNMFLLTSALAFITTNDVVILVMTPIILELCRQSRIKNAQFLFLSQFVAANTLSMGFMIGSPTNIIISQDFSIDFFDYLQLMLLPAIAAIVSTFVAMFLIYRFRDKFFSIGNEGSSIVSEHYMMPALKEHPEFTKSMKHWILFLVCVIIAVVLVSQNHLPFFYVSLPTITISILMLGYSRSEDIDMEIPSKRKFDGKKVVDYLCDLPYQIVFFALSFFAVAETLSAHINFEEITRFFSHNTIWESSLFALMGTGTLVNLVNDLPAAAIAGHLADSFPLLEETDGNVILQSMLAALNMGCYVTAVGSLAGIMWFHILKKGTSESKEDLYIPSRWGMVKYGLLHFIIVAALLSVLIPFFEVSIQWLFNPGLSISEQYIGILIPGGIVAVSLFLSVYFALRLYYKVRPSDVMAFLSTASWASVRSGQSRQGFRPIIALAATLSIIVLLRIFYFNSNEIQWLQGLPLSMVIVGAIVVCVIYLVLNAILSTGNRSSRETILRSIAKGNIIIRRSVIIDYQHYMKPFINGVRKTEGDKVFQVVLYEESSLPESWSNETGPLDIYTEKESFQKSSDLKELVNEYRLEGVDEVYLLGNRFFMEEESSMRICKVLDTIVERLKYRLPSDLWEEMKEEFLDGKRMNDPEDYLGRVPRVFIFGDEKIIDMINKSASSENGDMEELTLKAEIKKSLLIELPREWSDLLGEDQSVDLLNKNLKRVIAGTFNEKSWVERKRKIIEKLQEISK